MVTTPRASRAGRCAFGPPGTRVALFFFFNDTATTEIYTLSLHDALPISQRVQSAPLQPVQVAAVGRGGPDRRLRRSEEHTSELQSPCNLVCRLLLEKNKLEKLQKARHRLRRVCVHHPRPLVSSPSHRWFL